MIGRFVHQQDVGPSEQHARHRDAHLPPAGECADVAVDPVVLEPEAVQHLARLRFEDETIGGMMQSCVVTCHVAAQPRAALTVASIRRDVRAPIVGCSGVLCLDHRSDLTAQFRNAVLHDVPDKFVVHTEIVVNQAVAHS